MLLLYGLLSLYCLFSGVSSVAIDNGIAAAPDVECLDDRIRVWIHTRKLFAGRIYAKGRAEYPACVQTGYAPLRTIKPHYEIPFGQCGMQSLRSIDPRGMYYGVTIMVSFHPLIVTKVDQAFHVKCFFEEANRGLTAELGVSMLPTTEVGAHHGIPGCTYSIHSGTIQQVDNGYLAPPIEHARVGDKILHRWECRDNMYGVLINNCYVTDGFGARAEVVDSRGCPIDPILITGIRYARNLTTAFAESHVFKFADKPGVWFFCQIQMCMKGAGMCYGLTPPTCSGTPTATNVGYGPGPAPAPAPGYTGPPQPPYLGPGTGPALPAPTYPRAAVQGGSFSVTSTIETDIPIPIVFETNDMSGVSSMDAMEGAVEQITIGNFKIEDENSIALGRGDLGQTIFSDPFLKDATVSKNGKNHKTEGKDEKTTTLPDYTRTPKEYPKDVQLNQEDLKFLREQQTKAKMYETRYFDDNLNYITTPPPITTTKAQAITEKSMKVPMDVMKNGLPLMKKGSIKGTFGKKPETDIQEDDLEEGEDMPEPQEIAGQLLIYDLDEDPPSYLQRSQPELEDPPYPTTQTTKTYDLTVNPGPAGADGTYATSYPRVGAYWTLAADGSAQYPALSASHRTSNPTPPSGVPMDAVLIYADPGLEAHFEATTQANAGDTTLRLTGTDNSGVKFEGFADPDVCLGNPGQCINEDSGLKGISMSLWMNVPQQLDTGKKHIIDTGGDEYGKPGVKIVLRSSIDGRKHSQQISVLVSTGPQYWKVVLNGMTIAHAWNNLGFRWSGTMGTNNLPHGLQVYVNGSSVAWKRAPYSSGGPASVSVAASDVKMSLGCRLDGMECVRGKFDNLAAWYYALRDSSGDKFQKTEDLEIPYFKGGRGFTSVWTTEQTQANREAGTAPGNIQPVNWEPWQYQWEMEQAQMATANDETFLDDTSAATEGDCEAQNPSTWSELGHPIMCADTIKEMQNAIAFSDNYKGYSMIRAMIKTINKNDLSEADLQYLTTDPITKLTTLLNLETSLDHRKEAKYYAWLTYVLSRMQEKHYQNIWQGAMTTNQLAGVSYWTQMLDTVGTKVATVMSNDAAILIESNHTVTALMKTTKAQITAGVFFPDYSLETASDELGDETEQYYQFPDTKKDYWGRVNDWISLPVGAFDGWHDQATEIKVVLKLYNQLQKFWPAYLDSRVTGDGVADAKFFLNSRIISISVSPAMTNASALDQFPVKFQVEHRERQPDLPFKKGAILCVHWVYNTDPTKIGAWDTGACKLIETNDTHSICECAHMSDFAALQEDHVPNGAVGDGAYIFCYVLYGISLICLIVFVTIILMNDRLHYELHIVTMNVAFALIFAIIFYLSTLSAKNSRVPCLFVSVFMHYSYTCAYLWCVILAHYIFRALTKGLLGGILKYYCLVGWGGPALLVAILAGIDVSRYGIGDRCLGAQNDYFLWVYIGFFIAFCILCCPLLIIAMINWKKETVKDPEDKDDIKFVMIGLAVYWPIIILTWVMAIFIYLVPQDTQLPDFLFELFNSLQGICIFLLLGVMVPSFRKTLCSCCRKQPVKQPAPDDHLLYDNEVNEPPPQPVTSRPATAVADEPAPQKKSKTSKPDPDEEAERERKRLRKEKKAKRRAEKAARRAAEGRD